MKTIKTKNIKEKKEAIQLMIQGNIQEYINYLYGLSLAQ